MAEVDHGVVLRPTRSDMCSSHSLRHLFSHITQLGVFPSLGGSHDYVVRTVDS